MSQFEEILQEIKNFDKAKDTWNFRDDYKKKFLKAIPNFTPEEKERIGEILIATIKTRHSDFCDSVYGPILEKKKLVDWKAKPELINEIFESIIHECEATSDDKMVHYSSWLEKLLAVVASNQLFDRHRAIIFSIVKKSFSNGANPEHSIHSAALNCITKFPWGEYPDLIVEAMKMICHTVMTYPDTSESGWLNTNLTIFMPMAFRVNSVSGVVKINGVTVGPQADIVAGTIHELLSEDVAKLVIFCAAQDWQFSEDPSKSTICCTVLKSVLEDFYNNGNIPVDIIRPVYPTILELRECGDSTLERDAGYIIEAMADNPELNASTVPRLLEEFLQNKIHIAAKIPEMFKSNPEPFYPLLEKFEMYLADHSYVYIYFIAQLFNEVAKTKPEALTESMCDKMAGLFSHASAKYGGVQFFETLAARRPEVAHKYDADIVKFLNDDDAYVSMATNVLVAMATDDEKCEKYLNAMASRVDSTTLQPTYKIGVIYNMRLLGLKNPALLGNHTDLLKRLGETAALKDACQSALDVVEGRSLENITKEVTEQRNDIAEIDNRLVTNETKVGQLENRVEDTEQGLASVENRVNDQGQKLEELEKAVEETVEKVEDLDHKTLSHAPIWSRDVATLLNEKQDKDWRLLAFRMGYSAEDIRNWATQPNPCLSLFDDWFATHKTREATYAVLQLLVEMDRKDAADLVQKALDDVADVVEEGEAEPLHPPPIFLSYQWAHQNQARLLKRHLEMAGYSCWMDVGQMGGGDKLFSKIDAGMRAAKVVVCCVTQPYAESPNCNREVNLSVTLGKPIIPLLMEKMPWPPAGSMGPIFGEYLFVRFYQREGEEGQEGDARFWTDEFFRQLLMQIRYNVAPNVDAISKDSPYQNWWQPPEEILVVKNKNKSQQNSQIVEMSENVENKSPDVFISYQWDKQAQIKTLYRKLVETGYSCWLDILQMGGGDSLYDKIDKGVRGSSVVVSCVTKKYALSANCRREVSLSNAIEKPIVPVLLEKMPWPPEGPMGMILSPILYIDFSKSGDASPWEDAKNFDILLQKISQHIKPKKPDAKPLPKLVTNKKPKPPDKKPLTPDKKPEPISPKPKPQNNPKQQQQQQPETKPKPASQKPTTNNAKDLNAKNTTKIPSDDDINNNFIPKNESGESPALEIPLTKKNFRPNVSRVEAGEEEKKCCAVS